MQWRIPYFNSQSYSMAAALTSTISAVTAMYFIGSAVRAQRYLSNDSDHNSGGAANVANKAAMRRLMRRVLTSGCLMLLITLVSAIATQFIFHPTGFTVVVVATYSVIMTNSMLQIESFASATLAPSGPLRETLLALQSASRGVAMRCHGKAEDGPTPGVDRLRTLIGERRRSSVFMNVQAAAEKSLRRQSITQAVGLRTFSAVLPEPELNTNDHIPWASLPASHRPGVSHSFLLAILEAWQISAGMTTYELCDKYVRPACRKKNCGCLDLLLKAQCPEDWFGPMDCFVSHWSVLFLFVPSFVRD
jgi:hypothetical protein